MCQKFDSNNMDKYHWQKIIDNYPEAFREYMKMSSINQFMTAFKVSMDICEFYVNDNIEYECYVKVKETTVNMFFYYSKFEASQSALYKMFELIENQLTENRFEQN
jgi:hypothetical protein